LRKVNEQSNENNILVYVKNLIFFFENDQ